MLPSLVPPPQRTTLTQCVEHCELESRVASLEKAHEALAFEVASIRADVSQARLDIRTMADKAELRHGETMQALADLTNAVIRFLDTTNALGAEMRARIGAIDGRL